MYRVDVTLSDVDRGVYERLDLRLARHPSESERYLLTRLVAYCLSYEEGIVFSRGGLSDSEEPPIAVVDMTGVRQAWIDIGAPSAERLHKATKSTSRVSLYSHVSLSLLCREAGSRPIHRLESIEVWLLEGDFLSSLAAHLERNTTLELVRSDGRLYVTVAGKVVEGGIQQASLSAPE